MSAAVIAAPIALVTIVPTGGGAGAATDPTVEAACPAGTLVATTYTLTANCDTTVQLTVPDGQTINGGGFTITAHGTFVGAVLTNAGSSMTIENLTVMGTGFVPSSTNLFGIWFNQASGSVNNVKVLDITQHDGSQVGRGIVATSTDGTARTVTISNCSVSGYQKSGLIAQGMMTMNVTNCTIGPGDTGPGLPAQNAVTFGGGPPNSGASGSVTNSTIVGNSYLPGPDAGTAVLVFGGKNVTVSGNTITGNADVGVFVVADTFSTPPIPSTGVAIDNNTFTRTSGGRDDGVAIEVDTASSATATGNTFSGWDTNVEGLNAQPIFPGYWLAAHDGGVFAFGVSAFHGSTGALHLNAPVVGQAAAESPSPGSGYWLAAADGGVFAFGTPFFGSMGGVHLNDPVVGIASTGDNGGYYLVGSDGGVFAFGDAPFFGSMGGTRLNAPVVGIAITPDSRGYYLVGADGGVFAFGDAQFKGSASGGLPHGTVGIAVAVDNLTFGYWLVASNGAVFAFGAPSFGDATNVHLAAPVVGMAPSPDDLGYWLVASDGGVFAYGDSQFLGSMGGKPLNQPVVGMVSQPAQEPVFS